MSAPTFSATSSSCAPGRTPRWRRSPTPPFSPRSRSSVEDQRLARAAIDRLTDQALIRGVLKSDHWFARQAAAEKLDDAQAILDLIAGEQDLDVLDAAVTRLGELGTAGLDPAAIDKAREALKSAASAETEEAGSPRIITGSMPSAEKVVGAFRAHRRRTARPASANSLDPSPHRAYFPLPTGERTERPVNTTILVVLERTITMA